MKQHILPSEACQLLLDVPFQPKQEMIPVTEALDRVLAEDIYAEDAMPNFDKSPFDGYAFRADDTKNASPDHPVTLTIQEEIPAGIVPQKTVTPGTATHIFTGSAIPVGADCVVKFEDTKFTDTTVQLMHPVTSGTNVIRRGEEYETGTLLVKKSSRITPAVIGVLSSQGLTHCRVYSRPVAAVISTGSELTPPGTALLPAKIYDSNRYTITACLENLGFVIRESCCLPDDSDRIAAQMEKSLKHSDLIVVSGGASVGDYDFAVTSAKAIGASVLFWKVQMKPGSALLASVKDGKLILNLSGNPSAAMNSLLRVALPSLRKLCGLDPMAHPPVTVILKHAFHKKNAVARYLRGHLLIEDGQAFFVENDRQGNGMITSFLNCDLIGEIPAGTSELPAGTKIRAWRCDDFRL